MNTVRFSIVLLSGACLYAAGYQPTVSDNLTSIDSFKWGQIGSLSAGANGVTGNGSLISTVAVATGSDYDVRMTIHTANQGKDPCRGTCSLYARSSPDNTTAYVLKATAGSVELFREVAGSWTMLTSMPHACTDVAVMRLMVKGSAITFWSGPHIATYQDATPIVAGHLGLGISSSVGDSIGGAQIGPVGYVPPSAIVASAVEAGAAANFVDLRWPAAAADVTSAGLHGYTIYRDGIYLGTSFTPNFLDQTVTGGETTTYYIYATDQHGNVSAPATVTVQVPASLVASTAAPGVGANLRGPTAKSIPTGPAVDPREIGVRPTGSYWGAAGENIDLLSGNLTRVQISYLTKLTTLKGLEITQT